MKKIEKIVQNVDDNSLIALPEYSMFDPTGLTASQINKAAESLEGSWVKLLSQIAKKKNSCLIGTLFERNNNGKAYNTAIVINEYGEIIAKYRKTHLFDALGFKESELFSKGDRLFEPIKVCGIKVGLAICFEIRFPEIFRYQALKGAEIIVVPSGWYRGPGKEEQYRFLAQSRAHENVLWIAAPILYGDNFTGRSLIVNPYGIVVADAGHGETVLTRRIGVEEVYEARRFLPLLELRRDELYKAG